jgi:hypothetical protein
MRNTQTFAGETPVLLAERDRRSAMLPVPEDFTVGKPFATLRTGPCRSRFSGKELGPTVTSGHLRDMLRLLLDRAAEDPVVIDWNHGSSPSFQASEDPSKGGSLGLVVGGWIEPLEGGGEELIVIPAYNARGVDVVESNRGALWNSPEFLVGKVFAREAEDSQEIGTGQLLAVALTNRPAQVATTAEPVTLTESGPIPMEDEKMAEQKEADAPEDEIPELAPEDESPPEELAEDAPEAEPEMIPMEEHQAALAAKDEEIALLMKQLEDLAGGEAEEATAVAASERMTREVTQLRKDIAVERGLRENAEDEAHYQELLAEGKIAPEGKDTLVRALSEKRDGRPYMYDALFANATPNSVIDFSERGHNHKSETAVPMTVEEEFQKDLHAYAEKNGITNIRVALQSFIRDNKEA